MGIMDRVLGGGKHLPVMGGVDTVLGEGAKLKGELISSGSVNISGEFEGKIKAEEILISPGGKVVGELRGGSITVSGRVDGHIIAQGNLEINKTGKVHGDLVGGRIIIEEGSSYQGKVKVIGTHSEEEKKDECGSEEEILPPSFPGL